METSEYITIGAMLIALVVAVIAYRRSGQPVTLQGVTEIARDAQSLAAELQQVAEVAVASAQQLKESGKLVSNSEAFEHAVKHVETWYNSVAPDVYLDPQIVANAIEGAYFWLRKAQAATANPPSTPTPDADLVDRFLQQGGTDKTTPGAR